MVTSRNPPAGPPADRPDGQDDADFDAWFDRLAGRVPGPAAQPAHREADMVRAALSAEVDPQWQAHTSDEAAEREWQVLERQLAAARATKAAAPVAVQAARPAPSARPSAWQRWRNARTGGGRGAASSPWPARWAAGAALAAIAVLAVTLSPWLDAWRDPGGAGLPPAQVLMGGPGAGVDARVQTRATRTPRRDADAFAAALRASPAAAQPSLYSDPHGAAQVVIVEVELDGAQLDSAGTVFEAHGLRRPSRVGLARVEFGR